MVACCNAYSCRLDVKPLVAIDVKFATVTAAAKETNLSEMSASVWRAAYLVLAVESSIIML